MRRHWRMIPLPNQRALPLLPSELERWLEDGHEQAHGPAETCKGFCRREVFEASISYHESYDRTVLGKLVPLDRIPIPRTVLDMGLIVVRYGRERVTVTRDVSHQDFTVSLMKMVSVSVPREVVRIPSSLSRYL